MHRYNNFPISPGGDGDRSLRTTEQSPHRHLDQHRQAMQRDKERVDYAHERAISDLAKNPHTTTHLVETEVAKRVLSYPDTSREALDTLRQEIHDTKLS